jgi:hypothetical protein
MAERAPIEMRVTRCRIVGMLNTNVGLKQRVISIFTENRCPESIKCLIQNGKSTLCEPATFQMRDLEGFFVHQDNDWLS